MYARIHPKIVECRRPVSFDQLNALQGRLHRLHPGEDRTWLEYKVNLYQLAVDKHGTCCLQIDALTPPTAAADTRPLDRPKRPR